MSTRCARVNERTRYYRILAVIHSALIHFRHNENEGCTSNRMLLHVDCIMRAGPHKGMRYRLDVHVSPRGYSMTRLLVPILYDRPQKTKHKFNSCQVAGILQMDVFVFSVPVRVL